MSILSKLLKKTAGIPEVDLKPIIGPKLMNELYLLGPKVVFGVLSDEEMKLLDKAVQVELYRRRELQPKEGNAGIGKGY